MTAGPADIDPTGAAPRSRRRRPIVGSPRWEPLLWMAPALAILLFVFAYALYSLFRTALERNDLYVGFENFRFVLDDPTFRTALVHNVRLLIAVPVLVVLALVLAILLFEGVRGWRVHRSLIFLPYILAIPVVGVIFGQLFQFNGIINETLRALGLDSLAIDWLGRPKWALWTITIVIIWKELGLGVLLFLARMLSLPEDAFDAAKVDGAGFYALHRHITIPQLTGVIWFFVTIEAITMISWVFNYVYVMTGGTGGPGDATQVTELYIYQQAFVFHAPNRAAAAAVLLFLITMVVIAFFVRSQARSEVA